jgi:hypothetical protein
VLIGVVMLSMMMISVFPLLSAGFTGSLVSLLVTTKILPDSARLVADERF